MGRCVTQRDYRILIGAAGWLHEKWGNEVLYPEDLPEDWYLSFYANEFPIVLVPDSQWNDEDAAQQVIDEITELDTQGFKCIFELDWKRYPETASYLNILEQLGSTLSGLLLKVDTQSLADKNACESIIALKKRFNICLELKGANESLGFSNVKSFCEENAVSLCWTGDGEAIVPNDSRLWVTRCNSEQDDKSELKELKILLAEQLKRESQKREHVLIIDGQPPKIEVIRNASVMMDIM